MTRNIVRGVLSGVFGLLSTTLTRSNERQLCVFAFDEHGIGREEWFEEVNE